MIWRKGKGAIGVAWALSEPQIASVENLEQLAHDKHTFCGLEPARRYGLSWHEFEKSKHYRAILAVPLEGRPDRVVGCLSVDVQLDGYADKLGGLAKSDQFSNALSTCETVLGRKE